MPATTPASIDNLSDFERLFVLHQLADRHPRIFKQLLDRVGQHRTSDATRAAMPAHPFTRHEFVEGTIFCYWRSDGTPCLRTEGDPRHVRETEPGHV